MPGCVLRVSGPFEELSKSLARAFVPFKESVRSARDRERSAAAKSDQATFNYTVSEADGDHVPQQIRDAEAFVSDHADALQALSALPGVTHAMLDFGWQIPCGAVGQWNRFPATLLSLCASAHLDIEVSVYLVETSELDRAPSNKPLQPTSGGQVEVE